METNKQRTPTKEQLQCKVTNMTGTAGCDAYKQIPAITDVISTDI